MRRLVCSGRERAAAESLSAADTVPGVRPRCWARVLSVALDSFRAAGFLFLESEAIHLLPTIARRAILCKPLNQKDIPPLRGRRAWNLRHSRAHNHISSAHLFSRKLIQCGSAPPTGRDDSGSALTIEYHYFTLQYHYSS